MSVSTKIQEKIGSAEGASSTLVNAELLYIVNANLKKLKTLEFAALDSINDEGLISLAKLEHLIELHLYWMPSITVMSLYTLAHIGKIKTISIYGCKNIRLAAIAYLKNAFPHQSFNIG